MRYNIRNAMKADATYIASLMGELGYEMSLENAADRIEAYRESVSSFVLVAQVGDRVEAFVSFHAIPLFHTDGYLGRITAMCVSSQYRRQGVGKALIEELEVRAKEIGCERVEVSSGDNRASDAHVFYQSCGYNYDCRRFLRHIS